MYVKTAVVIGVLWVASGCAHQETQADSQRTIQSQDRTIQELTRHNDELAARLRVLETELETLRIENRKLASGKDAMSEVASVQDQLRKLEEQLGRSADFTLKPHADGLAFEVAETLLFDTGKAMLREEGKEVLRKLASRLEQFSGNIRVEGHTDNQPVVVNRSTYPRGNLELSGERALSVAHFLVTETGIPASRISFAGFGEHRPVADNSSRENQARNRRVEIVLLRPEAGTGG